MPSRRHSALDFSDGDLATNLARHPDLAISSTVQPSHLQRNINERRRLQGLQRANTTTSNNSVAPQPLTWIQKFDVWLINEGSHQIFFAAWVVLHHLVVFFGFINYELGDNYTNARKKFGITFAFARAAALMLHVDIIFILFPVCRNFISLLRRTPLNSIIPFEKNITFHQATAWSIVVGTVIHVLAHMVNFAKLAAADPGAKTGGQRFGAFLAANFATGPGVTGWIMTASLFFIVYYALEKKRSANFERFWYSHHLFIVLFICWQLHGMFCMIKPDRPPFCSWKNIGVFWKYWLPGGIVWVSERILREIRSRHVTYISKVVQHPSNVMELQIKKEKTPVRAGQYIFICCPEVSYFQWHPFTLTSAPEEDYISIHIRVVGDFTSALAKAVGCDFESKGKGDAGGTVIKQADSLLNRTLPRVMVDGPFGSASEDFLNYETVLLVGAGIGVTPFASILKSIWYRMNNFHNSKPTRLSKASIFLPVYSYLTVVQVYFTWVIRDFGSAEWFHSLLHAIEEQDTQNRIEINIYLTAKLKEDDIANIMVQDVGADRDAITSLRAPTHFGRPNWGRLFGSIAEEHPETDVGVFFCGPGSLSKQLHAMCNKYSTPEGTKFFYGKENF
ncbi:hypothetical protein APHAL10511_004627 [Amanita phalloides]|nr:hypothetical protein APHAL10511_004627 [Amanita phalloides]